MERFQDIKIDMEAVKRIIDEIGTNNKEFLTIDVIRKYLGSYKNDSAQYIPWFYTFDSQFGRLLKSNMSGLNIKEVESGVDAKDDFVKKTTTSKWEII